MGELLDQREAFNRLWARNDKVIRASLLLDLLRKTNGWLLADDAMNDAYVKLLPRFGEFRGESDKEFQAWVKTTAKRIGCDVFRALKDTVSLDNTGDLPEDARDAMESNLEREESPVDQTGGVPDGDASSLRDRGQIMGVPSYLVRQWLDECLKALPKNRQPMLILRSGGLRYREIAAELNVPAGTVRGRLPAAQGSMRECYNRKLEAWEQGSDRKL